MSEVATGHHSFLRSVRARWLAIGSVLALVTMMVACAPGDIVDDITLDDSIPVYNTCSPPSNATSLAPSLNAQPLAFAGALLSPLHPDSKNPPKSPPKTTRSKSTSSTNHPTTTPPYKTTTKTILVNGQRHIVNYHYTRYTGKPYRKQGRWYVSPWASGGRHYSRGSRMYLDGLWYEYWDNDFVPASCGNNVTPTGTPTVTPTATTTGTPTGLAAPGNTATGTTDRERSGRDRVVA